VACEEGVIYGVANVPQRVEVGGIVHPEGALDAHHGAAIRLNHRVNFLIHNFASVFIWDCVSIGWWNPAAIEHARQSCFLSIVLWKMASTHW
jgi:hypothetical protein